MSIFSTMGSDRAEKELERAMNETPQIHSEIKPFTTKIDSHILEAIDAFALEIGSPRNTLVVNLLNEYLPIAISQYFSAHYEFLSNSGMKGSEEQHIFDCLSAMSKRSDLSDKAKEFLTRGVVNNVIGPGAYEETSNSEISE